MPTGDVNPHGPNASFSDADFSLGSARKIDMPGMSGGPQGKQR